MKAVHIELSDEAVHFVVAEVAGEDQLLEASDILDDELHAISAPVDDFGPFVIVENLKGLVDEACNLELLLAFFDRVA